MNSKSQHFYLILVLVITTVLINCKTSKEPTQKTFVLPQIYPGSSDSSRARSINIESFFNDSTLISLIDTAIKNNLDLLIALQKIEQARAMVRMQKGALLPTIGATPATGQTKYGLYTMDGAGNSTTNITPDRLVPVDLPDYSIGLQSSWEVDIRGKLRNKRKAAVLQYLASIEGRNWAITTLIAEITNYYYDLQALDNELDILKETIELQENAFRVVSIQKGAGAANELAVEQFEAQLLNSKKLEVEILQLMTVTENKINLLTGGLPKNILRNKLTFSNGIPLKVQAGIPSDILVNRPDIRKAELEVIAAKANVKAARAAFYPSFVISGSLGLQAFNPDFLLLTPESSAYRLFGNLIMPLINRSAIKAEFKSAKASQLEALYNYQKSIIYGYVEVYNQIVLIKNLEKMFELKTREVTILTKSIGTSSQLFQTGRANYLEVLMAQKNALQSRLDLVDLKKRQYNAVIDLYKALGGGWR